MRYSFIIPVYREGDIINLFLSRLKKVFKETESEILVVDGDFKKSTLILIEDKDVLKISSEKGRARQMNLGAEKASGDILIFIHADTFLPLNALIKIEESLKKGRKAGAFKLRFESKNILLKFIAFSTNIRVCFSGIPYGDQVIFVKREVFEAVGGYPDIPLMEDVELIRKLKRKTGRLKIIRDPVISSVRRWEENGILKTTGKNILIRTLYFFRVPVKKLASIYYG